MAIVCQECGALGYEDLFVYCSLCHQAAQHKYCMDTLPNNNEDSKWSCEDCNRMSIKLSHVTNGQGLKIPNNNVVLSAKSNAYLYQDKCKLFISNGNKMINSKDSSTNDLHGAHVSDGGKNRLNLHSLKSHVTKAWGKNNKRTIKSIKPTLETYIDPLRNRGTTSQPFQQSKNSGRQRKLILLDEDDDSKDEIEKDYPLDQSFENGMPNYHRRKLVLSDEEDEQNNNPEAALLPEKKFCSKNNEMKEIRSTLKKTDDEMTTPNYHRRKLVLSDEEDEQNNNLRVKLLSERIVCSKNNEMKEVRSTLKKMVDEMPMPNYHRRKLVLSDEEDEQNNNLEATLLPERIVCSKNNDMKEFGSTLKKMDDEMTIETDSGGDSMKILSANSTSSNVQLRNVQEFEVLRSEFYFILAMPIRSYSWRGWFEISGRVYGPLTAHLSTKAGEKALNATKFLSPIIQLTRVSMSHAWPKSFGNSPSADHIALFFFPLVDSGKELTVLYKQGGRDGRSASRRGDQPCCGAKSSAGGGGDASLPLCFVAKRSQEGWFKICGRCYGPLITHLSPKACEKAWNTTRSLSQIIPLSIVSRSQAWPRNFKSSPPTDDHIALFFFPPDSRVEEMVDQLIKEVIWSDLMLKVSLDEAELLIFPSNLLPVDYNRYQDKYYLWGVFKRKNSNTNTGDVTMPQINENFSKKNSSQHIDQIWRSANREGEQRDGFGR